MDLSSSEGLCLEDFHKIGKNGIAYDICDRKIANYIIENQNIIIIENKPYIYKDGVYKYDKDGNILKYLIRSMILEDVETIGRINRVYNLILIDYKLHVSIESVNNYPSSWINFKNGMLDVKTNKIHNHDPKYHSINQIPHNYVSGLDIEDTIFYKFLQSRIPDPDNQRMLFEFMGYCMTKDITFQKFLILFGRGESGKSTIINLLTNIVGIQNTCSISLQQLGDRFTTASLLLKTLNTCGDMTNNALTDTSVIKQLTGDDLIKGEYKGGDIFFFRNCAKMIFSCNELPKVLDDKTNGFYRRLLLIPFGQSGDYIPNLQELISKESEIEMIISGCISFFKNALISGKLFESRANLLQIEKMRADSDSTQAFMLDCVEKTEGSRIKRSELYLYYSEYCQEEGRTAVGKAAFNRALERKGYTAKKTNGIYYYNGIDVKWTEVKKSIFG